ncbi:hypothetical protein D1007_12906 [Hordeum vulgare]|nr:hypothetical protein D1007_12906 [Hordeum vulgare]
MELLLPKVKYKVVGFDLSTHALVPGLVPRHHQRCKGSQEFGHRCQNLVNIHGQYKMWGSKKHEKDSLVHLVEAIIDPYYRGMKDSCNKDKHAWHSSWKEKLDKAHVVYAAKEAYTIYDMCKRIVDMRRCLLPQNG